MAGATFPMTSEPLLDIVCLANVQRVIRASKDVDEMHAIDDDGVVDGLSPDCRDGVVMSGRGP